MKSIIISFCIVLMIFTIVIAYTYYLSYDNAIAITQKNLKRSLAYVMKKHKMNQKRDVDLIFNDFINNFKTNNLRDLNCSIYLINFNEYPLLVEIMIEVKSKSGYEFRTSKIMIEEE